MNDHSINELLTIATLINKQRTETLNADEQSALDAWLAKGDHNRRLFEELSAPGYVGETLSLLDNTSHHAAIQQVYAATGIHKQPAPMRVLNASRWRYAAAVIIILLGIIIYLLLLGIQKVEAMSP